MPDGSGFPLPVTPAERAAVALYSPWLNRLGNDDDLKTDRLVKIKAWCEARK